MSKVTITVYDDEEGGVSCQSSFDPEIPEDKDLNKLTGAQKIGVLMLSVAFPPDNEEVQWNSRQVEKNYEQGEQ